MTGAGLLLEGGTVFDGLGNPGRVADVAVVDGRVVAVGDDPPAGLRRIGDGLAVAPGSWTPTPTPTWCTCSTSRSRSSSSRA